jgi:Predicted pyridoxal phosphate-dependent enzyme apparently involved in regulation of cell wall biogenesis
MSLPEAENLNEKVTVKGGVLLITGGTGSNGVYRANEGGGVNCVFHYVPLHSSPAGLRYGRAPGALPVTENIAERLVRLPLFVDMTEPDQSRVLALLESALATTATMK